MRTAERGSLRPGMHSEFSQTEVECLVQLCRLALTSSYQIGSSGLQFQTPGGPLVLPVWVNFNPPPDTQISSAWRTSKEYSSVYWVPLSEKSSICRAMGLIWIKFGEWFQGVILVIFTNRLPSPASPVTNSIEKQILFIGFSGTWHLPVTLWYCHIVLDKAGIRSLEYRYGKLH